MLCLAFIHMLWCSGGTITTDEFTFWTRELNMNSDQSIGSSAWSRKTPNVLGKQSSQISVRNLVCCFKLPLRFSRIQTPGDLSAFQSCKSRNKCQGNHGLTWAQLSLASFNFCTPWLSTVKRFWHCYATRHYWSNRLPCEMTHHW